MRSYIAVHYNGQHTSFTTTETLEAARAHLINLISEHLAAPNDILSIIETSTDTIIYYSSSQNTVEKLQGARPPKITLWQTWLQGIRSIVYQLTYATR